MRRVKVDKGFNIVNDNSNSKAGKTVYGSGSFSDRQLLNAPKRAKLTITLPKSAGKIAAAKKGNHK